MVLTLSSALALSVTNVQGTDEISWPIQSAWIYEYSETYRSESIEFSVSGTLTNTCDRQTTITVDDEALDVVCFRNFLLADIVGEARQATITGGYIWVDVWGTYKVESVEYYDTVSGTILRTVSNETIDIKGGEYPGTYQVIYHYEHNDTDYDNFVSTPSGFDLVEQWSDLGAGTSWDVEYTTHSEVQGVSGTTPFEEVWDLQMAITYNYLGSETLTVPAGVHDCVKIQYVTDGFNTTKWYCPDFLADAKITTTHSDGEVVWTLQSYEPGDTDDGLLGDGNTMMILALAVVVPVVAAIAAVAAFMWIRRRDAKKGPPPQAGGEVG